MDFELVVLDIEGCIKPGDRSRTDLEPLNFLQDYCGKVNRSEAPPVILLTGRPVPYCEAVIQDIGALGTGFDIPSIAENGAMYWSHNGKEVPYVNPALKDREDSMEKARKIVEEFKAQDLCVEEPGKEHCISLNPVENSVEELHEQVSEALAEEGVVNDIDLSHSSTAVDITPGGVNKRSGLLHLLEKEGIDPEKVLGVGDSSGDVEWLKEIGQAATPRNGSEELKGIEDVYVSDEECARGVRDIIRSLVL